MKLLTNKNSLEKVQAIYKTMLFYCLKHRKKYKEWKPKCNKKSGRIMFVLKYAACNCKKSRFITKKKQVDY